MQSTPGTDRARRSCRVAAGHRALVGVALCFVATQVLAQERPAQPGPAAPRSTVGEGSPGLQDFGPPITAYPAELLGLLAPPAERGPITLRPSIAVSEEYNDNVLLNNQTRKWDLITRVSPGLTLTVNRPSYQLSAGYTLSGELYANESRLNDAWKDQAFVATGLYRGLRGLTVTVADSFALNRSTNQAASQGFATGRQETWNNTFTPGMTWEMTPRNTLNVTGTFAVQRFLSASTGSISGSDSNTYALQTTLEHVLTRRLTGILGYGITYLDLLGQQENSTTHTPTVGARYMLTPTLTASVSGGPAITQLAGETSISPGGSARLVQVLQIGSVSLEYTRGVGTAGGFGGTTDTQTISAGLSLPTWYRGLVVAFTPSYRIATSVSRRQASQIDIRALTVPVAVNYQFARYSSIFAEYTYFQQQTGSNSSLRSDVDQNRLRFGLQFGYPFNFE